ncbi:hypothetical protein P152DRAFT_516732, partial [Eremomyces bilateralis CBS 781.70]
MAQQRISDATAKDGSLVIAGNNEFHGSVNVGASKDLNDILGSLPTAKDAPFYAHQRRHDPTCLDNTRVGLREDIDNWVKGENSPSIFWLSGLAGTGKSTVARTVSRYWANPAKETLGASFFFSRGGGDVGHAGNFVTSVAVQLANKVPDLKRIICNAISAQSDIANRDLSEQWRHLVLNPLSQLAGSSSQPRYILVVDALDECEDENDIQTILQLLAEVRSLETVQLRVFLTSRPDVPIRNGFIQIPNVVHRDFILHEISSSIVDHDIRIFLRHKLEDIARRYCLPAGWPDEHIIGQLVDSANELFIWAATACRFIEEGEYFAADRISIILKPDSADDSGDGSSSDSSATDNKNGDPVVAPQQHLDNIYITILKKSIRKYRGRESKKWRERLGTTMGTIAVLYSPLSTDSLGKLLHATLDTTLDSTLQQLDQTLNDLHAILDVPKNSTQPLRLHHPSFRDFLLDPKRCTDLKIGIDEKQAHKSLATSCIKLMSGALKQDILSVDRPGALVTDIETSLTAQHLPPEVRYACLYWIQHLQRSEAKLQDGDQVHRFLQEHFLHWLETLGWMGQVSEGIHTIASLESLASISDCPSLSDIIYEAKRFVVYNRYAIGLAPLQTYCSALAFAPTMSIIRKQFANCIPRWIRRLLQVEEKWNAVLQTLEGHSSGVSAVAFSPDGKTLASGSHDGTVRPWPSRRTARRWRRARATGRSSCGTRRRGRCG